MRTTLLPLFLLFPLAACTSLPTPSPYRQVKIDSGVQKTVTIDGRDLQYWDKGDGPVMVLLHGLGGSLYDWRFLYDDFVSSK